MDHQEFDSRVNETIERLAPVAARAERVVVLTGAGVSAESGVPTFRDVETGLWAKYDPVMLASVEGFNNDPATVWKWYDERRQTMRAVDPRDTSSTMRRAGSSMRVSFLASEAPGPQPHLPSGSPW